MRVPSSQLRNWVPPNRFLDALGMLPAGRQAVGEIAGDVVAAIGNLPHQRQPPTGEMGEPSGAAAEVQHQAATLQLILGKARDSRGVGRRHDALDLDVATLEAGQQVAQGSVRHGDQMRHHLQPRSGQAAGIPDRSATIDRNLDRNRMQYLAFGRGGLTPGAVEQELEVGIANLTPVQSAVHAHIARLDPPAAHCEPDLAQGLARLLLGLVQRTEDRGLGRLGVDDLAAL